MPRAPLVLAATLLLAGAACSHRAAGARPDRAAEAPSPFRRIVTGLDAAGRSTIVEDGAVPAAARVSRADLPPDVLAQAPFLRSAWHVVGDEPCVVFTVLLDATGPAIPR